MLRFSSADILKQVALATAMASAVAGMLAGRASAENIAIESDKTQLISISKKPGTVVVGNPSIADVSINGSQIFLHGHGFGNTNIIILDAQGGLIKNFDVTVKQSESDAVTIYKAGAKFSMVCQPTCEYGLQPGDSADWFKSIVEQQASKNSLATGSETNEAKAPTAPQ